VSAGIMFYPNRRHQKLEKRIRCGSEKPTKDADHPYHRCDVFRGHVLAAHRCVCGMTWKNRQGEK